MCIPIGDCYAVDYGFKPTFHIGVHDFDYFIKLTVTNHARLVTTKTIKVFKMISITHKILNWVVISSEQNWRLQLMN